MIYFIQQGEDGPIKIGRTDNIKLRIKNLQAGNPFQLRMIGLIPEEADLHRMFSHLNMRGEWFEPDDDLLNFIQLHTIDERSEYLADEFSLKGLAERLLEGRTFYPHRLLSQEDVDAIFDMRRRLDNYRNGVDETEEYLRDI